MAVKEQEPQQGRGGRQRWVALSVGVLFLVVAAFAAGVKLTSQPEPAPAVPAQVESAPVQMATLRIFVRVNGWLAAPGRSVSDGSGADSCFSRAQVGWGTPLQLTADFGVSGTLYLPEGRYQGLFPGNNLADRCVFYVQQDVAAGYAYHVQVGPYEKWVQVDAGDSDPQVDIAVD